MMDNSGMSFLDIITHSGVIGILIWSLLFILSLIGIILGILAIVSATRTKTDKYPIAFKLLICCIVATILAGIAGTVIGYVDSFPGLASARGTSKAQMLRSCMRQSRICFQAALFSGLVQLILFVISWMITHIKFKQLSIPHLSLLEQIKKIQILVYAVVLTFIPVAMGVYYSLWGIEEIVLLKHDEILPTVLGMKFAMMLKICFASGCLGLILLFLFLIKTFITHYKNSKQLQ